MRESQSAPEVARCKEGDEEGFRRLFEGYRGYVYSLCFSIVSDRDEALDACQEVFLAVFRGIASVRDDAPLKPWLRRVAVNVCLNYNASARSGRRTVPVDGDMLLDSQVCRQVGAAIADPARMAEDHETRDAIRDAIGRLHPDHRLAVVLFHQEGLTYDEIGAVTGWPLGTVKTNLYRGRKEMGRQLRSSLGGSAVDD